MNKSKLKSIVLLLCLFALGLSEGWGQTTYTLGSGTNTNTSSGFGLVKVYNYNHRIQYLIRASELTATGASAGNITQLSIYVYEESDVDLHGFNIRLKETSTTALNGTFESGATTVYSADPQDESVFSAGSWTTFDLTTPFEWDGTSNVLVEFCYDNQSSGEWGYNGGIYVYTPSGSYNCAQEYHSDSYAGCGTSSSATTSTSRAQMKFTIESSTPSFHNTGGSTQLAFNNSYIYDDEPTFRVSHENAMNVFQIEVNTASDFSGTSHKQSFSGTYSSGTQYNLDCDNLDNSWSPANGTTYYVRVRASDDGGSTWGGWSSDTYSFTYKSSGDPDWYQTTTAQFNTGTVVAGGDSDYGNTSTDEYNSSGYLGSGEMMWYRAYVTEESYLESVSVRLSSSGGNVIMAVYDADGDKIAVTNSQAVVSGTNTLNTTTNPLLSEDTYYRIAVFLSSTTPHFYDAESEGESYGYYTTGGSYGDFPSTLPTGTNWPKRFHIFLTSKKDATTTSPAIEFASFDGASAWQTLSFTTSGSGTVTVGVYDNANCTEGDELVAPSSTSPIDISSLGTEGTIYLKATLTGANPSLDSWTVSGNFGSPAINTSTSTLSFSDQCYGTTSSEQTYTVEGTDLTDDILITPPEGFEISKTSGSGFVDHTGSLTIAESGGSVSETTIYVRFSPSSETSYSGNIAHTSDGASNNNISISGDGVDSEPTVTAGSAGSITSSTATISGNTISAIGCSSVSAYGIEYSTTDGFADGAGTPVAGSGFSGSSGGTFSADLSGLTSNETYYYKAYATNSGGTAYSTQASFTTACADVSFPYFEDFDEGELPTCWSIETSTGSGWQITDNFSCWAEFPNLSAPYAGICASSANTSSLISQSFDFTDHIAIQLSFKHRFRWTSGVSQSGKLYYSTNGGSTWTEIQEWTSTTSDPATFSETLVDLNDESNVKFKWEFTSGSNGYWWAIDDIEITAVYDDPTADASLSPDNVDYDLDDPDDVESIVIYGVAATIDAVEHGATTLVENTDYTISESGGLTYLTIKNSYLSNSIFDYPGQTHELTIDFNAGASATLTITAVGCAVFEFPFNEEFSGASSFPSGEVIGYPAGHCYSTEQVSGGVWTANASGGVGDSRLARLYSGREAWMFIPVVLTEDEIYVLSFYARHDNSLGEITVKYGDNNSAAAMNTGNTIISNRSVGLRGESYNLIQESFVADATGVFYLGFLGKTESGGYSNYLNIDNISLEHVACAMPTNLNHSNVTDLSATISWDAANPVPGDGYQYVIHENEEFPADPDIYNVASGTSEDLTVSADTRYYVWVRSNCGSGDFSNWQGPISFKTECGAGAGIPFVEDFDGAYVNDEEIEGCYYQEHSAGYYRLWKTYETSGNFNAQLYHTSSRWLFIPVYLEEGIAYDFSVDGGGTGNIEVKFGQGYSASDMDYSIISEQNISGSFTGTITEHPVTGTYYIGIYGDNTGAAYISIDNIRVDRGYEYRSKVNGNWNQASTWEIRRTSQDAWTAASAPPNINSNEIAVLHNVTVSENLSVDQLSVGVGGNLIIPSGINLTIEDGPGNDLSVDGHITNAGTITTTGNLVVNEDGKYYHNYTTTAGTIPTATWSSGSHCEISGYTSNTSAPSGLGQSFHHFAWNCTSQSGAINLAGNLITINGDLNITSTGSGSLAFASSQSPTIAVAGDFNVSSGTVYMATSSGEPVMNLSGDFIQSGGTLNMHSGSSNLSRINIEGNFNQTAGTITESGSVFGRIYFTAASGTQSFKQEGTISNDIRTYKNGAGTLELISDVTLPGLINFNAGTLDFGTTARTFSMGTGNSIDFTGCAVDMSGGNADHNMTVTGSTSSVTFPTTWTHGSGDSFEFANTGTIDVDQAVIFNHLLMTGSGTVNLNDNTSALIVTVLGDFTQNNGDFVVANNSGTTTFDISGDFNMDGGDFLLDYSSGESTVIVGGNFNQTAGVLDLSNASFAGSYISTLELHGNFEQSGGEITETYNNIGLIQFAKAGTQTYAQSGTISNVVRVQIDASSTLSLQGDATWPARTIIEGTLLFGNSPRTLSIVNTNADVLRGSGTIDMQNADHLLQYSGSSVLFDGTFTAGNTGTVAFVRNGNQTLPNWEYRNLLIEGTSGDKTFGSSFNDDVTVNGNLTVNGSGADFIYYTSSSNGTNGTLSIGGDLIVQAGTFRGTNDIGDPIIEVQGDVSVEGGNLYLSGYGASWGIGVCTYNLYGSLTRTSGELQATDYTQLPANVYANVNFVGTGAGDFSASTGYSSAIFGSWDINIGSNRSITLLSDIEQGTNSDFEVDGTLIANTQQLIRISTGYATTFTLNSGATLQTAHPDGITSDASAGTIYKSAGAGTHTVTFSSGANYVYNGSSAQVTGSGLPASVNNFTVDNANGVTLSDNLEVTSNLYLTNGILSLADEDELEITGAVTGASASSFVNGSISRTDSNPFEFPTGHIVTRDIGSGEQEYEVYAPILITPSEAATFSARYLFTDDGLPTWWYHDWTHEVPLKNVSNREYWKVDADKPVSVELNWRYSGDCIHTLCDADDIDESRVTVAFWDNDINKWRDAGGSIAGGSTPAAGSITSGQINFPFSGKADGIPIGFGGKDANNPLPVQLLYFDAECSGNDVIISWLTATESNSEYFVLQKSTDLIHFSNVALIEAAGNSVVEQSYELIDRNEHQKQVYYRLLQKDFDKEQTVLAAINADCVQESLGAEYFVIYPNPVSDVLIIKPLFNENTNVKIEITDQAGRLLQTQNMQSVFEGQFFELDLNNLKSGVYYLKIHLFDTQIVEKVVKI